jgi:hypothetical protein
MQTLREDQERDERDGRLDQKWEMSGVARQIKETGDDVSEWIANLVWGDSACPEKPHPSMASMLLPVPLTKKKNQKCQISLMSFSAMLCGMVNPGAATEPVCMNCGKAFERE